MPDSMNTPFLPVSAVLIATTPTVADPSLVGVASQYGLPGLMILALGSFAIWQERQRNKREDVNNQKREERETLERLDQKETHASLFQLIREKDVANSELVDWIKKQVDK